MTPAPASRPRRTVVNALITAGAQAVVMGLGAVLALVVLLAFGTTRSTDGLFAAYGVYGVVLMVAQSLRTTVVGRFVEARDLWDGFDRHLGIVVGLSAALILLSVGAGGPIAQLLTGDADGPAHDTAREALVLFAIAGPLQLVAALGAAALAVRDDYVWPALSYLGGGSLAIVLLLALAGPAGILGVSVAVAAGSALNAAVILRRLGALGWRPRPSRMFARRGAGARAGGMLGGSAFYAGSQAMLVVSLAFAARLDAGDATIYTYAFFAAAFVAGVSSGAAGIVLAAPVAKDWDRRPSSLVPHVLRLVRLGLAVTVPVVAVVAVAGEPVIDGVLGGALDREQAGSIALTFVALSGYVVAMLVATVPLVALFALGRYGRVAVVAGLAVLAHVAFSAVAQTGGTVELLGAATSVSMLVLVTALLVLLHGRAVPGVAATIGGEIAKVAAVGIAAFGLPAGVALALGGGAGPLIAAAVCGCVLYVLVLRLLLPEHWDLVARLATRRAAA